MSNRMQYSQNNSVAFSRICAIWGVGDYMVEEVTVGEVYWVESMSTEVPGRNNRSRKQVFLSR
jgi:hypothetical protein